MSRRYAVYYAPERGGPLHSFASAWLGRDAIAGVEVPRPTIAALPADLLHEITAAPRRYGFHATLKAPFELAQDATEDEFHRAVEALAVRTPGFRARLALRAEGPFLAVMEAAPSAELAAFAAACVVDLDHFRAPMSASERDRRLAARLTDRERSHLDRWGYPYVLDAFRFHMTLTGPLETALRERVRAILAPLLAPCIAEPHRFTSLSIFEQPDRDAPFVQTARFPLRSI